ncbi:hypothetical protein LTR01_006298 [Friedmanniomyces endolithicus]|nr:hypothetical protein LTS09_014111 [Friedmanniomyces endolithicus]KAK0294822.1 hypothetical protein LTS00_006657 [Friedmanniomyces endolithicus]KAK0306440.1 hypothetical protein LTR01_006298 [Friedmanniomyces endolithicus]KAK0824197.1 hypothetical protein LTR73_007879 [Friedmanniomyces endolithicus]
MVTTATDGGVIYVGTITPQPTSPDLGPLTTYTGYPPEFTWYFTSSSVARNTHDPQHHPVLPPWPLCFFCPPHLHLGGIVLKLPPGIYPPSIKPPWGFPNPFPRLTILPDGTPEYPSTYDKPSSSSSTSSTRYIPFSTNNIHGIPSTTISIHGIPSSTRMPSGEPSSTRASSSTSTSTASSSCTKATVTDFWISCAAGSTSCKTTSSSIVSGCSASPTASTTSAPSCDLTIDYNDDQGSNGPPPDANGDPPGSEASKSASASSSASRSSTPKSSSVPSSVSATRSTTVINTIMVSPTPRRTTSIPPKIPETPTTLVAATTEVPSAPDVPLASLIAPPHIPVVTHPVLTTSSTHTLSAHVSHVMLSCEYFGCRNLPFSLTTIWEEAA